LTITWLSTKSPLAMLYDPIPEAIEHHLRQHAGICSTLLARDLGISLLLVHRYQRQLGLRPISNHRDYK
jgi:hypothetical protein